jgi:hypothetical protein
VSSVLPDKGFMPRFALAVTRVATVAVARAATVEVEVEVAVEVAFEVNLR